MPELDCTVVIPVFNRGEALHAGIESLRVQTLGPERFEVIYVDDGSNDGRTPAMIDGIVAQTPNARVFHEPPSGSPGRPRNIGLANARGEYVFFADHDDWFDPQALERLCDCARRNGSDVVIGKVVGHGRRIPIPRIFRESRADLPIAEAMISLTPHKLFRREFLLEHQIRFPEGKRRLEDHHFVTHAYLHAGTISVYADRVCYHHAHPGDGGNFSQSAADPDVYTAGNVEVMELICRHTGDDTTRRDALLQRPLLHELINKAGPRLLSQRTPEDEARKHRALRAALVDVVPPGPVDRLGAFPRAIAAALRDDDPDAVRRIDASANALSLQAELVGLRVRGAMWTLDYRASVTRDGSPVRFDPAPRGGGWTIEGRVLASADADRPEREEDIAALDVEVLVSSRRTDVQWHLPATSTAQLRPIDSAARRRGRPAASELLITGTATIDLTVVGGEQIGFGVWDLVLRTDVLGLSRRTRLAVVDESALPDPPMRTRLRSPKAAVRPIVTPKRTLALQVKRPRSSPKPR